MKAFLQIFFPWILLLGVILFIFFITKKYNKDDLAKHFKVSKKTLARWVELLPNRIAFEKWKSMRKLDGLQYMEFQNLWDQEGYKSMNKEQLWRECGSNYETLAENVKMNLEKIGISIEAWNSLSVFPPSICCRILTVMG